MNGSTVVCHFYSSFPLSNLLHCLCHVSLLFLKHPNKSFFNPINIYLTSFTTLYLLFYTFFRLMQIFILVVCGMHGYINRFWAGQRLFFKKMNIEQEEKLQQEINRLARWKVQKLKRERKLQTKSSRERLKSFSKQGKYFKRRSVHRVMEAL